MIEVPHCMSCPIEVMSLLTLVLTVPTLRIATRGSRRGRGKLAEEHFGLTGGMYSTVGQRHL